jgi:thiol-disulfide isomerase/thioredoxin
MKSMRWSLWLLLLVAAWAQAGAEVRPFESGSLDTIRAARAQRPFILTFWSIDCAHCPKELKALGEIKKQYPKLDIVLVSTDHDSPPLPLADFAAQQGLAGVEQWVFADPQVERLRYEIDRHWWGELPRTYFFDAEHRLEGVSGVVPAGRLQRWAADHVLFP